MSPGSRLALEVAEEVFVAATTMNRDATTGRVGITFASAAISNPRTSSGAPTTVLDFLVDTGAIYSVVPSALLTALGIEPFELETFGLADGTKQTYPVGEAFFELGDRRGTSKVVFAPAGVTPLLGAFTLESLGLMVNPVTRELLPMRLFLATKSRAS
jgi:predicted aspartyl protease